ncbi:MAG: septum formation protein Maf [Proteobacteria bacterium]|nr:septum formation protein Maf [Pseudomonadota bacterium]
MVLVLASTSPWRLNLLTSVGFSPIAVDPKVDEDPIVGENPVQTAQLRAAAKSAAVLKKKLNEGADRSLVIVAADQVVYLDDVIFGKPRSDSLWFERLKKLRGQAHGLTTAVEVIFVESEKIIRKISFHETTKIHMRSDLSDEELWAYVRLGEASGCAGGYMVERGGAWLISQIEGDYSNVVGLPIPSLVQALRELGLKPSWLFKESKN